MQFPQGEALGFHGKLVYENGKYFLMQDGGTKYACTDLYNLTIARTCIHKIASECSKAKPDLKNPNKRIEYFVGKYPNPYQTCSQFLYQTVTTLLTENNAYIVPLFDEQGKVDGLWSMSSKTAQVGECDGQLWLTYDLGDGVQRAVQYEQVGHLKRMQYQSKLFGENNDVFKKLAGLYEENLDKSINALEANTAPIRWMGQLNAPITNMDDLREEQRKLAELNMAGNNSGVFLYDGRFTTMQQVMRDFKLMTPDDIKQMETAAYNYWGVSEAVLQNKYTENEWNAFYQSAVEPILDQIGEVLTKMVYSRSQITWRGDAITFTSNRLQYASIKSRMDLGFGACDRGLATYNTILDILNLPELPGDEGNDRYIRGEYRAENGSQSDGRKEANGGSNSKRPDIQSGDESEDQTD
jgi:HK97 family phage portal protein